MKYYKAEYWQMMNSNNPTERSLGSKLWDESVSKYDFPLVMTRLPKQFSKIYTKYNHFHDYEISKIVIENTIGKASHVTLTLSFDDVALFYLLYKGVVGYNLIIPEDRVCAYGRVDWGYDEFEFREDGYMVHRILGDLNAEIEIVCKTISLKKIPKKVARQEGFPMLI